MSSKTEIINRSLIKIISNTIADPTEQARKANAIFGGVAQSKAADSILSTTALVHRTARRFHAGDLWQCGTLCYEG